MLTQNASLSSCCALLVRCVMRGWSWGIAFGIIMKGRWEGESQRERKEKRLKQRHRAGMIENSSGANVLVRRLKQLHKIQKSIAASYLSRLISLFQIYMTLAGILSSIVASQQWKLWVASWKLRVSSIVGRNNQTARLDRSKHVLILIRIVSAQELGQISLRSQKPEFHIREAQIWS